MQAKLSARKALDQLLRRSGFELFCLPRQARTLNFQGKSSPWNTEYKNTMSRP